MDLFLRQGTSERLTIQDALRRSHGDAIGAGAITSDRTIKGGVYRPGLKDDLGVIYLSAREGVGPRRATTRDAGARFFWYLGA